MHAQVYSATTIGVDAFIVEVEADLSMGLINFFIVGLPDKAIKESKDRIRAAFKNSGLRLPEKLITVNLAPASLKKEDVLFDVPIAVALLQAAHLIELDRAWIQESLFLGELALSGEIKPVCGVLSIVHEALRRKIKRVIVPQSNVTEACLIEGIDIIGITNLCELVSYLRHEKDIPPSRSLFQEFCHNIAREELDFSHVKGQLMAKRALTIAAAGRHNILFIGPPGSGKTMLAQRLGSILAPMNFDQIIETTKIYSVAGALLQHQLITERPFRSPHHTISQAGLVGGGSSPKPGEISLAHNGILFLDELTEFSRSTLEVLREPLESGRVLISRARQSVAYPASFQLVAALNPCPCGFYGDASRKCICTQQQIYRYMGKLSGPLLDRIDLHLHVAPVKYEDLKKESHVKNISSAEIRTTVEQAHALQYQRQGALNAELNSQEIDEFCELTSDAEDTLRTAFSKLALSMRAYHKIIKIARTIADLAGTQSIHKLHIQEALSYRTLDRFMNHHEDL